MVRELMTLRPHDTYRRSALPAPRNLERDHAIAANLDALMRAATTAEPELTVTVMPIGRTPGSPAR